ncbi:phosphohydrolase [Streptomyces cinereus]|nr:phosphohydrolase [Streptomyces cinereus]
MGGSMIGSWLGHLGALIAVLVILWSCLKTVQLKARTDNLQILLQLVSFYARYWFVWLLLWANVQLLYDNQIIYWLLIALSLLYIYMSWVEPNRLRVSRFSINLTTSATHVSPAAAASQPLQNIKLHQAAKIAVLSDIHIGIFSNPHQLARLVKCLNRLDVDAVLILGDWLYQATTLDAHLSPFKTLNKPCYTVLSDADTQQVVDDAQNSEPASNMQLMNILPTFGIQLLPEQGLRIAGIKIIGIHNGSTMDLPRVIEQQRGAGQPLVIATHDIKQLEANPRTLSDANNDTLVIAGQTHGGQVNIPILTPLMVRALTGNKLAAGLRQPDIPKQSDYHPKALNAANKPSKRYQVWVNTGIGMTGLPFRFNCPPTIDVLTIQVQTVDA